jgi:hypothetical protein
MPIAEAIAAVVTTAVRLILEKARDGEVYICVEYDGSYTVDSPDTAATDAAKEAK